METSRKSRKSISRSRNRNDREKEREREITQRRARLPSLFAERQTLRAATLEWKFIKVVRRAEERKCASVRINKWHTEDIASEAERHKSPECERESAGQVKTMVMV